jgi:hypothetical protein
MEILTEHPSKIFHPKIVQLGRVYLLSCISKNYVFRVIREKNILLMHCELSLQ